MRCKLCGKKDLNMDSYFTVAVFKEREDYIFPKKKNYHDVICDDCAKKLLDKLDGPLDEECDIISKSEDDLF